MRTEWIAGLVLAAALTVSTGTGSWAVEIGYKSTPLKDGTVSIGVQRYLNDESGVTLQIPSELYGKKVTAVDDGAFYLGMDSVRRIILPEGIVSIGDSSFRECKGLEEIILPDSLRTIGADAFSGCGRLKEIVLPEGVETIGDNAFAFCTRLEKCSIPSTARKIGSGILAGSLKADVSLSKDNTGYLLQDGMLLGKDSGTLLWVKPSGFRQEMVLPETVRSIGDRAFEGAGRISRIVLHSGIKRIGREAFAGCDHLESIEVASDNNSYRSISGVLYDKKGTTLVCYPAGRKRKVFSVPEETLMIESGAAEGNAWLEQLRFLGDSVYIGDRAFEDCVSLKEVDLPYYAGGIGEEAFRGCLSLSRVTVPGGMTGLSRGLFSGCSALTDVCVSYGIAGIGEEAFADCTSLQHVILPRSLERIDCFAFAGCSSLKEICLPSGLTDIDDDAFDADLGPRMNFVVTERSKALAWTRRNHYSARTVPRSSSPEQIYESRDIIAQVQEALNDRDYSCGAPDGVIGRKTENAVRSYAKEKKLELKEKDGKVLIDTALLDSLGIRKLYSKE